MPDQWSIEETVVLAVGAHPDDVEAACGGTLIRLVRAGVPVHVAILTGGEHGIAGATRAEARERRTGEAATSASLAGATGFHSIGMEDLSGSAGLSHARGKLVELVRRLRANLLITHPPGDYHADHRAAAELALEVRISSAVPGIGEELPLERSHAI